MDKIINLGIPHIGEQIFESIETEGLIEFLKVSETWKNLAENVLIKRWKGKIYEACDRGKTKVVQLLLEHCDADESGLNIKYNHGFTALIVACHNGRKDVVQLLLNNSESNIDLNARTNQGCTGLMLACIRGQKDVVKLLLDSSERNIDLNARNNMGWTTFMKACASGHKDVVQLFLDNSERNIDLNARNDLGKTAHIFKVFFDQKRSFRTV